MNYSVDETGTINTGKMVRFNLSLPLATSNMDNNTRTPPMASNTNVTVTTSSIAASPNINGCNITYQQQPYNNQLHSQSHSHQPTQQQIQQQIQCNSVLNEVQYHQHQPTTPLGQQPLTSTNRFYSIPTEPQSFAPSSNDHRTLLMVQQANSNQVTTSIYNPHNHQLVKPDTKIRRAIVYTIMTTVLIIMLVNSMLIAWIIGVIHFNPVSFHLP